MSELPTREWRFYVDDMISFPQKVVAYSAGPDQQAFLANDRFEKLGLKRRSHKLWQADFPAEINSVTQPKDNRHASTSRH
jgi:hypothetical protein